MIYLASPYTHPDKAVEQARYERTLYWTAKILAAGDPVFSPIVYGHQFIPFGRGTDFQTWTNFNSDMISSAERMFVLQLDGWQASRGVGGEIALAEWVGIPVTYIPDEPHENY